MADWDTLRDIEAEGQRAAIYHAKKEYRNPGEVIGAENLARVRSWYLDHLGGKQVECAEALGLSVMAVNRHVADLRNEWRINENVGRAAHVRVSDMMAIYARACELVDHEDDCPAISGNGGADCNCDAVSLLNDLRSIAKGVIALKETDRE